MIDKKQADILQRLVDGLDACKTDQDMKTVLTEITQDMGFEYFAYGNFRAKADDVEMPYVSTTYPPGWTRRYISKEYYRSDPVVQKTLANPQPFVWHADNQRFVQDQARARFFVEASEHGVKGGYTVPIFNAKRQIGLLSFSTDGSQAELDDLSNSYQNLLPMIGMYYHQYVSDFLSRRDTKVAALSRREVQCLRLAAVGKSAFQIGRDVGISYRTVYNHWDNARNKLGVSNIRQALAICVKSGIITFD